MRRHSSSSDIPFSAGEVGGPGPGALPRVAVVLVLVCGLTTLSLLVGALTCALCPPRLLPLLLPLQCALLGWAYRRAWRGSCRPACAHAILASLTHGLWFPTPTPSWLLLLLGCAAGWAGTHLLGASPSDYHPPHPHPHT